MEKGKKKIQEGKGGDRGGRRETGRRGHGKKDRDRKGEKGNK